MTAEVIELNGYRQARQYMRAAAMELDAEQRASLEGMARTYERRARWRGPSVKEGAPGVETGAKVGGSGHVSRLGGN